MAVAPSANDLAQGASTAEGEAQGEFGTAPNMGDGGEATGDGEGAEARLKKKKSEPRLIVPFSSEEIDEAVRQAFDLLAKEVEREEYDNGKVEYWKTLLEDHLVRVISNSNQPFKFTFYVSVCQNSGDAMHISLGAFYENSYDGYMTGHWENDDVIVDVVVMAFSIQ
ncbi:hypothetical protein RvY_16886 [Ramazzottius varieornatus]|uniref:Dynein light chain n=1 Tax=Ramazzottius varieornatus TaxID=947166 RepID=A0A1D1W6B5_RAMVA|nr:hypothetical protein RvY_16886 [Ramazzottius varieornatus]